MRLPDSLGVGAQQPEVDHPGRLGDAETVGSAPERRRAPVRSSLFGENVEVTSTERMALQNPRMLRVRMGADGAPEEIVARQGAMVAYQGEIEFAYQGGGVGKFLKKVVTGEGVPLMRCRGRGDLFLAQDANELHMLDLDGDSVTVNGANVLAFEPGLTWDIRRVEGASMLAGGVFNMVFTGTGRLVVSAFGTPVVLNTSDAPTYADLQSAIAWSSSLQTSLRRTAGASALIGRGSGEAFQLAFSGQGFVVVQASEGSIVVPTPSRGSGVSDLFG
ncbi:MAG TPA: AIM24 family protein [Mycobacteriales bacterium]|nr:AIM24 family protein [Mycobacteriales bacterium]